jgi:hypothetical protein
MKRRAPAWGVGAVRMGRVGSSRVRRLESGLLQVKGASREEVSGGPQCIMPARGMQGKAWESRRGLVKGGLSHTLPLSLSLSIIPSFLSPIFSCSYLRSHSDLQSSVDVYFICLLSLQPLQWRAVRFICTVHYCPSCQSHRCRGYSPPWEMTPTVQLKGT